MHLAETREELQLLKEHTGPLRDLLDEKEKYYPLVFNPYQRMMLRNILYNNH